MLAKWAGTTVACSRLLCSGAASLRVARRAKWENCMGPPVLHYAQCTLQLHHAVNINTYCLRWITPWWFWIWAVVVFACSKWDLFQSHGWNTNLWSQLRKWGMNPCIFYAGKPLLCSEGPWWRSDCMSLLDARALFCSSAKQVIHKQQQHE